MNKTRIQSWSGFFIAARHTIFTPFLNADRTEKRGNACLIHRNPFGLTMRQSMVPSPDNRYLYNCKELQQETQWLDYGARMYDPALGRWHTPDPLSDQYYSLSPYNYVANNPLLFIDPDGREIDGDTERVEELKDEANRLIKYENKRQSRLQAKIEKRSAAGKSTKKQERRLANSKAIESQLNGALAEISALEASETVYYINSDYQDQADGTSGNIGYDDKNNR